MFSQTSWDRKTVLPWKWARNQKLGNLARINFITWRKKQVQYLDGLQGEIGDILSDNRVIWEGDLCRLSLFSARFVLNVNDCGVLPSQNFWLTSDNLFSVFIGCLHRGVEFPVRACAWLLVHKLEMFPLDALSQSGTCDLNTCWYSLGGGC